MYRQIFVPTEKNHNVELPSELYGRKVEVIAFAIPEEESHMQKPDITLNSFYDSIRLDLSSFKFDRDEANER